ncbi:MAG: hypothetical protein GXY08_09990, partial [Ruminococcus sp.]|nr:hypothetical protein [Ruminococcus sp.]
MKNKNVFDMLEDAEDEPMKELTDNCPDISKEQFERLLEKTERRYTMRKNEIDKNINEQSENTVSGVERVKRPAWIKPITMAASFVLVAGMVIGSVALLNKNSKNNKNSSDNKIASDTIDEQEADDEKTVFNDKDVLIDLCTDIPGHFNKMTLSYKAEYFSGSYKSITDVKMEYDKSEKALLVDSYDRYIEDNPENCYDLNFIYYFYKNKRISVKPVDTSFDYAHRWFTVDSLYDTPSDDPIYNFHGVSEWDYKGMFSGIYPESKEEWAIIGRDTVCGRECVVIQDTSVPTSITTYIDSQT